MKNERENFDGQLVIKLQTFIEIGQKKLKKNFAQRFSPQKYAKKELKYDWQTKPPDFVRILKGKNGKYDFESL